MPSIFLRQLPYPLIEIFAARAAAPGTLYQSFDQCRLADVRKMQIN